jgi:hypothetical protein
MAGEALAAVVVGIAALWLVLQPLIRPRSSPPPAFEPLDPEETPKGVALSALKEIEFDRETGKLSDDDYELLKAQYTVAALEALRGEQAAQVSNDAEALIAARVRSLSSASDGTAATRRYCDRCGAALVPDARFCEACGRPVAA